MTDFSTGQPVQVRFGPRTLEGYVDDTRIHASFGTVREHIVVDTGSAQISARPSNVTPV